VWCNLTYSAMETNSDLLLLQWNSYKSNFSLAFGSLRETSKYHDVTFAMEDGHVEAHRVVVSACSPILARILDLNPHPHPLVYFKGIRLDDFNKLLDFMYKGEVRISHENLEQFLTTAGDLKIKGLSEVADPVQNQITKTTENVNLPEIEMKANSFLTPKKGNNRTEQNKELKRKLEQERQDESLNSNPKIKKETSHREEGEAQGVDENHQLQIEEDFKNSQKDGDSGDESVVVMPINCDIQIMEDESHDSKGEIVLEKWDEADDEDTESNDYTGKTILTRSEEDKKIYREILQTKIKQCNDDTRDWECKECLRRFTGKTPKRHAESHVDHIHTDDILHKCVICNNIFNTQDRLIRHIAKEHKYKQVMHKIQKPDIDVWEDFKVTMPFL